MSHSKLAPSAASRWLRCTASVQLIEDNADRIADEEDSPQAREGTEAHDLAEKMLKGEDWVCADLDMVSHVEGYVEMVKDICADAEAEMKVPLFYRLQDDGTIDAHGFAGSHLHVFDLKYGAGVEVPVIYNPQPLIYALSVIEHVKHDQPITGVTIHIYQPRCGDEAHREWEVPAEVLYHARQWIESRVRMIEKGDTQFVPSESTCRFCPAAPFCDARMTQLTDMFPEVPVDPPPTAHLAEPQTLSDEHLALFVRHESEFTTWIKKVKAYLIDRMQSGKTVEGLKLVEGRKGNRKWADEEEAAKRLKRWVGATKAYTKTLVSPTQAEKLLKAIGKKRPLDELITRSDGKPVVAIAEDERPAIESAADHFEDLDQTATSS